MLENNQIYQLALRPFAEGNPHLSDLCDFIEHCADHQPFPTTSDQVFHEVLMESETSAKNEPLFYGYLAFIIFLIAAWWEKKTVIALSAAALLWNIGAFDKRSADQTLFFLIVLQGKHKDTADRYTTALLAGLRGLYTLRSEDAAVDRSTLLNLDMGIAFPGSPFKQGELGFLLLKARPRIIYRPRQETLNLDDIERSFKETPDHIRSDLLDIYPRAFFALRKWRLARDAMDDPRFSATQDDVRDSREILETPGLDYLTPEQRQALEKNVGSALQRTLDRLQACIYLLNQAKALLKPNDPWPLTYWIESSSAELRLLAYQWTKQPEILVSAYLSAVRAAWSTRHQVFLFYAHARGLVGKIYLEAGKPSRAKRIWEAILRKASSSRGHAGFGWPEIAATAGTHLARISLSARNPEAAKKYCLDVVNAQAPMFDSLHDSSDERFLDLTDWSANFFDIALVSCAATRDTELAVKIAESWQSASSLRHRLGATPLTEASLRNSLEDDLAVVYLSATPSGASIILISKHTSDGIWVQDFTLDELKSALGPWFKAIHRFREDRKLETMAFFKEGMDRTLRALQPIAISLLTALPKSIRRVILIPGRGFGLLPLHAIPLAAKDASNTRICDRFDVIYAPNASIWSSMADVQRQRDHDRSFCGAADPGLAMEAEKAAQLWGAIDANSVTRTVADFMRLSRKSAVLHISCHGDFDVARTSDGRLEVSASLTLGEDTLSWETLLASLRLAKARLVVLSACESLTLSHRDKLQQQFGLPYAFIAAGAPLVLGSSWVVEGTSTQLLVTRFHENLTSTWATSLGALREAQLWLRQLSRDSARVAVANYFGEQAGEEAWIPEDEPPYAHPYYWAGFRLLGADFSEERGSDVAPYV